MDHIEYEFEVKHLDIQIQGLETEMAAMLLQKERLNYEKIKLASAYSAYISRLEEVPVEYVDGIEPVIADASEELEEIKPRRLKK